MWTVSGKTILITGATRGIGFEAAVALAARRARVLIAGRDEGRTAAAVAAIRARAGAGADATPYLADFASQASVRALAASVRRDHARLDVLVNNAGGVNKRRELTADGIERTFATNHLGAFLLTNLLIDLVLASAPARVVTVASIGHRDGTIDFGDLGYARGYSIMRAYRRSKLANVLFANELARRLAGTGVTSNSLHPGAVATNIWTGAPLWARPLIAIASPLMFIPAAQGAATIVQLVASPDLDGVTGQYFESGRPVPPAPAARDAELARRLWETSADLVGVPQASAIPGRPARA